MAERDAQQKLYAYGEMSNKVEQADRSQRRRRDGEGTGVVESLRGRTDAGRMGDRVSATQAASDTKQSRPAELVEKMERAQKKRTKREQMQKGSGGTGSGRRGENILTSSGGQTILDLGTLTGYQPSNPSSRAAYERFLNIVGSKSFLGNQPTSILRDAAEEIIATLKDSNLRDPERHESISRLLTNKGKSTAGGLSSEQYATFVQLGKGLDDYDDYANRSKTKAGGNEEEVDEEMGVAVVFDESDEEKEGNNADDGGSDVDEDEVVEVAGSSSEEESESDEEGEHATDIPDGSDADEEKIVQGQDSKSKLKRKSHAQENILSVHEIDAHFLQRQLSRHYDDADVCAKIADDVLSVLDLNSSHNLQECENKLLVLLGRAFELFDVIKLILNNRVKIWGCVSLKRANNDSQRDEIEAILKKEGTGEGMAVWEELHSKSRAEDWTKERIRGLTDSFQTAKGGNKSAQSALGPIGLKDSSGGVDNMEIDENTDGKDEVLELDLDSLAFREGSHVMSNKKCDLPETSWRAMKVGYEEVHVPAVRSIISSEERLIPIKELPAWTNDAFEGMDKLNRIQSKMCDAALRSSENILLCAPTGAGMY
eukprot:scaffold20299_cov53-Attheya_sp.AAC.1